MHDLYEEMMIMRSLLKNGHLYGIFGGHLQLSQYFFVMILNHLVLGLLLSDCTLKISDS